MPKPLKEPPPTSSIASILDSSVTRAATTRAQPAPEAEETTKDNGRGGEKLAGRIQPKTPRKVEPAAPLVEAPAPDHEGLTGEKADIHRQFIETPTTDRIFSELHMQVCLATGAQLNRAWTHRALMHAVGNAMESLTREVKDIGPVKLPKNARGNEAERDAIEKRIAAALAAGLRAAPNMRGDNEKRRR